jgi:UDP-N-acetylmuramoyl-tripeptide--D-alanyl-D-alanine ligase
MSTAMMTLQHACEWIPGAQLAGDGATVLARVHTDTRTLQDGDLFVALKGERFDANDFLAQAKASGAAAVLCNSSALEQLQTLGLPGLIVPDTLVALGQLAAGWRAQFTLPLIAVTGSNGKTTVTQMIASILRAAAPDAALATQGNFNNAIGVPLTLLRLRAQHRLAVLELGMNHPGEIAGLAALVRPTVALVNNAQREHQEFMATVQAVAEENGAVIAALDAQGVAVYPADDEYTGLWQTLAGARRVRRFALASDAAAQAEVFCLDANWLQGAWSVQAQTPAGELRYTLAVAGRHNLKNSLAAVACALAAGVSLSAMAQGLNDFEAVKGRSRALALSLSGHSLTLIDDSYNANPDSVRAAIDLLAELPAPLCLVLGDMGEVGAQGPQFHAEVGAYARACGIAQLYTLGELARHAASSFGAGRHFDRVELLNAALLQALPQYASVLVKGSRFMQMERVVAAVTDAEKNQQEGSHAA